MMLLGRIIICIVLLWIVFYTISFGRWTWSRKNKLGAVAVVIAALAAVCLPIYSMLFRE